MDSSGVEPISPVEPRPTYRAKWEWVLLVLSFLVGGLLFHTWILAYLAVLGLYIRNIIRLIRRGVESYEGPGEGTSILSDMLASLRSHSSPPIVPRRESWYIRALVSRRRWVIITRALIAPPFLAVGLYSMQLLLFITGSVDGNTNESIQEPFFPTMLIIVTGVYYVWAGNAYRDGTLKRHLAGPHAAPDREASRIGPL